MPGLNPKSIKDSNVLGKAGSCSQGALQPKLAAMLILVQSTPAAHPPPASRSISPCSPVRHIVPVLEEGVKLFVETAQGTLCI